MISIKSKANLIKHHFFEVLIQIVIECNELNFVQDLILYVDVTLNSLLLTTAKGAIYALHKFSKLSKLMNESDLMGRVQTLGPLGLQAQLSADNLILLTTTSPASRPRIFNSHHQTAYSGTFSLPDAAFSFAL